MRFANIFFCGLGRQTLGDNIQLIAIDLLLQNAGVSRDKIIYIDKNKLATYDGEPVILPFSLALVDYIENGWANRFSKKITPVFIGLTMARDWLYEDEVNFFRKHEPIGCRDERTYNTLSRYCIDAYLSGCITLTLPQREVMKATQNKTYLVDIPDEIAQKLPASIRQTAITTTHLVEDEPNPKAAMANQYNMYKEHAGLVITSLLHCTSPCIAAGIPVICIKSRISYRFAWIDKLLPIYDAASDLSAVDWSPLPINVSSVKEMMTEAFYKRILSPHTHDKVLDILTNYWLDRNKSRYTIDCFDPYETFIKQTFKDSTAHFKYSIWGLTQMSEMVHTYLKDHFHHSELLNVYDKYRTVDFFGKTSTKAIIPLEPDEYLFVTTQGAENEAKKLIEQCVLPPDRVCLMRLYY